MFVLKGKLLQTRTLNSFRHFPLPQHHLDIHTLKHTYIRCSSGPRQQDIMRLTCALTTIHFTSIFLN